ncbi:MAG TPA: hypothetical protein VJW51_04615 [Candidatus Acidoferrales bacterium]|nr:hypothetical protein [Candidatus Acidoferrales bacterium]
MKPALLLVAILSLASVPARGQELKLPLPCESQPQNDGAKFRFHRHAEIDKKLAAYVKENRPEWFAALQKPRLPATDANYANQLWGCSFMNRQPMKGMTVREVVLMWGKADDLTSSSEFTILTWRRAVPSFNGWDTAGVQMTFRGGGQDAVLVDWLRFQ